MWSITLSLYWTSLRHEPFLSQTFGTSIVSIQEVLLFPTQAIHHALIGYITWDGSFLTRLSHSIVILIHSNLPLTLILCVPKFDKPNIY